MLHLAYLFISKQYKLYVLLIAIALSSVLSGCDILFGVPYKNDPVGNFDFFFYELENNYAYYNYTFENGRSISDIKNLERQEITSNPTWDNLSTVLARIINEHIADPHVYSVYSPVGSIFFDKDGALSAKRPNETDFDDPIFPNATNFSYLNTDSDLLFYGIANSAPTVGYIYVNKLTPTLGGVE